MLHRVALLAGVASCVGQNAVPTDPGAWINEIDLDGSTASMGAQQGSWGATDGYLELVFKKANGQYVVPPQTVSVEIYGRSGAVTTVTMLKSIPVSQLNPPCSPTNSATGCGGQASVWGLGEETADYALGFLFLRQTEVAAYQSIPAGTGDYRNYALALCTSSGELLQWVVVGDPIAPNSGCASRLSPAEANRLQLQTDGVHETVGTHSTSSVGLISTSSPGFDGSGLQDFEWATITGSGMGTSRPGITFKTLNHGGRHGGPTAGRSCALVGGAAAPTGGCGQEISSNPRVNCAGGYRPCTAGCMKTYQVTVPAENNGIECSAIDGAQARCSPGEGACSDSADCQLRYTAASCDADCRVANVGVTAAQGAGQICLDLDGQEVRVSGVTAHVCNPGDGECPLPNGDCVVHFGVCSADCQKIATVTSPASGASTCANTDGQKVACYPGEQRCPTSQNCDFQYGDCTADCNKPYQVLVAAANGGTPCEHANGTQLPGLCAPGEGACPEIASCDLSALIASSVSLDRGTCPPNNMMDGGTSCDLACVDGPGFSNPSDCVYSTESELCQKNVLVAFESAGGGNAHCTDHGYQGNVRCSPVATCQQGHEYQGIYPDAVGQGAPTETTDRSCLPYTSCLETEYQSEAPTPITNRACQPLTICATAAQWCADASCRENLVQSQCTEFQPCNPTEYYEIDPVINMQAGAEYFSDRKCIRATACSPSDQYQADWMDWFGPNALPGPFTADRRCSLISGACDFHTQFERAPPTASSDRDCVDKQVCDPASGEFEISAGDARHDGRCGHEDRCGTNKFVDYSHTIREQDQCRVVNPMGGPACAICATLAAGANAGPCVECSTISSPCDQATQFEFAPPTWSSDRMCDPLTTCRIGDDKYELQAPNFETVPQIDRICRPIQQCDSTSEYAIVQATSTSDATCATLQVCQPGHFDNGGHSRCLSPHSRYSMYCSDRACTDIAQCSTVQYEAAPPTTTTDRQCNALTPCDPDSYERNPPRLYSGSDQARPGHGPGAYYESNHDCVSKVQCDWVGTVSESLWQFEDGTTSSGDRHCTAVRNRCSSHEYEAAAPTRTSDRVCAPVTARCQPGFVQMAPPNATHDIVCIPRPSSVAVGGVAAGGTGGAGAAGGGGGGGGDGGGGGGGGGVVVLIVLVVLGVGGGAVVLKATEHNKQLSAGLMMDSKKEGGLIAKVAAMLPSAKTAGAKGADKGLPMEVELSDY